MKTNIVYTLLERSFSRSESFDDAVILGAWEKESEAQLAMRDAAAEVYRQHDAEYWSPDLSFETPHMVSLGSAGASFGEPWEQYSWQIFPVPLR